MGVHGLWPIIQPTARHAPLEELAGLRVAIDLAIWVVDDMQTQRDAACAIPGRLHLRNLFFRTAHLLKLGAQPLFVVDGEAPMLKVATMAARSQNQKPQPHQPGMDPDRRRKRVKFRRLLLGECCKLLDLMGVPYVESPGEAESLAALLNSRGIVDIVVTNDGDAFLYGAKLVLRNFSMSSRDAQVHWFESARMATELGLTRDRLVALALLLGCDYAPKGVPGVGRELALKFLRSLAPDEDALARLEAVASGNGADPSGVGRRVAGAWAQLAAGEIAHEYLQANGSWPVPALSAVDWWARPRPLELVSFCLAKMDWAEAYTIAKVMPLLCLWDGGGAAAAATVPRGGVGGSAVGPLPKRILAERVRSGVPCFEVEFDKLEFDVWTETECYTLCVPRHPFASVHVGLVEQFEQQRQLVKQQQKKPKPSKNIKEAAAAKLKKNLAYDEAEARIENFFPPVSHPPERHGRSVLVDSVADLFADISLCVSAAEEELPAHPASQAAATEMTVRQPFSQLFIFNCLGRSASSPCGPGGRFGGFSLDASLLHLTSAPAPPAVCSSPMPGAAASQATIPPAVPSHLREAEDSFDKFVTPPRLAVRLMMRDARL